MNILLVYPNNMSVLRVHLGLAYISACLKSNGHDVKMLDTTFGVSKEKVIESCKEADLIGVSVMTLQLEQAKWISKLLKESCSAPILWGGNHPTVRPLSCINYDYVDMVCIGEGEEAVLELVDRLENKRNIADIENIWLKKNGRIYQNPVRPLTQDLDALPFPDRDIFDKRHLRPHTGSIVSGSRECPYGCGYCINDTLKNLYKGKGKYTRNRSVDNLLDELEIMRAKYGVNFFEFADETFTLRKRWVMDLCGKYKKRFGLPFIFQTRCDHIDRDVLKAIREAGCSNISFGIESGNEEFRNKMLGRKMSNETIVNAFKTAKDLGFRVTSFNMIGMPYETEDMIIDTIKINKKIKPHGHNVCIFYPFPGTRMGDLCEENGWIVEGKMNMESYYFDTVLKMPQLDRLTILTYQKFFPVFLRLPLFSFSLFKKMFRSLLKAGYFIQDSTNSKILKESLNNLYWLTSAISDIKSFKKLIFQLPHRIVGVFRTR